METDDRALVLVDFQRSISRDAKVYLVQLVGEHKARQAAARVGMAFQAAVRAAKSPEALLECSVESVVACVANSALTGLMPGGAMPCVWLVPKKGEMQWWLSHRGMGVLATRAGYHMIPIPVAANDIFKVEFGECTLHEPDPEAYPTGLDDLSGVFVTIRRLSDGAVMARPWMPLAAIKKRQALALTAKIWNAWPIEMAMKAAIRWCMARGYVPVDSIELQTALSVEKAIEAMPRTKAAHQLQELPAHADLGMGGTDKSAEPVPDAAHERVELDTDDDSDMPPGPPDDGRPQW